MPIALQPTRRSFLQNAAGFGFGAAAPFLCAQESKSAGKWVALLADTHIDADPEKQARGVTMAKNLERVVAEILAESTRPEFAVINGDCAYLKGLEGDYKVLRPRIKPLLEAGIPIHLTMGNHDDRGPFYQLFPEADAEPKLLADRHLSVVETEGVNWFLLDTLQVVNKVTGELGEEQRNWLSEALDKRGGKPAILIGHHYPQYMPEGSTARVSGLADTIEFMDLLRSKPQVKAYIYGHSHSYGFKKASGNIHLINQPPVAYLFNQSKPNGWIKATVEDKELSVELRALDTEHEQHGKTTVLAMR